MSDTEKQEKKEEIEDKKGSESTASAETGKTETGKNDPPGPIPYERFKEVNDRAKTYETRLAELETLNADRETAEETKRQDRLKEQEKFQELAVEWEGKFTAMKPLFEAATAELETVKELLGRYATTQTERVPELFREVVANMPLIQRLEWLTENSEKLGEDSPKGIPATPVGGGTGELSDDDRRRRAARTF